MHAPQACLFGFHGVLFMGFCSTVGTHGGGAPQKRHGGCACCLASLRTSCFPRSSPAVALILALRAAQLHVRNVLLAREGDPHRRHLDAAKGEHGAMVCQIGPAALLRNHVSFVSSLLLSSCSSRPLIRWRSRLRVCLLYAVAGHSKPPHADANRAL